MREIPPTAGLPLTWSDIRPFASRSDLASTLTALLHVDAVQITCSGTAALVLALLALASRSARREVVVPAYTCPLVAMAVAHCKLTLRVCDVDPCTLAMETSALEAACGPRTLAIIPTFLGGRVHDIGPVLDIARRVGAQVIEDAAQAMGARHADGTPVGFRGDIGFHSLAVGKGLTMYEGGVLMTRHSELRRQFADIASTVTPPRHLWELRRGVELLAYAAFYRPSMLRWVYGAPLRRALRREDIAAAAGDRVPSRIPLHHVGRWRQQVAARAARRWPDYTTDCQRRGRLRATRLAVIPGVHVVADAPGCHGVWPTLMLLMPDAGSRDVVLSQWWGAGVGVGVPFAHALPDYAALRGFLDPDSNVPCARSVATRILSISNSRWLDDGMFQRIVAGIEAAVSASGHSSARH